MPPLDSDRRDWRRLVAAAVTLVSVGCIVLVALTGPWHARATPGSTERAPSLTQTEWRDFRARRDDWVHELARTVSRAMERDDTDHPVFHGCIDWHSAVHAHWALLAASRITGDEALREPVDESLRAADLAKEKNALAEQPGFEMPYGRAWLLRLAVEDERVAGASRLRAIADHAARSLRDHYAESSPEPGQPEYDSAEWALRQMHDYYSMRGDDSGLAFVRRRVERSFLRGHREVLPDKDHDEWPEFFSRWGNWAHLLEATATRSQARAWLREHPGRGAVLRPVDRWSNVHHRGMGFSRAWGLWSLYRQVGERRFRDAAVRHIELSMRQHDRWKDDYAYAHWVPQFGIYAIAQTFEEPESGT